jgi:hypothetical protein
MLESLLMRKNFLNFNETFAFPELTYQTSLFQNFWLLFFSFPHIKNLRSYFKAFLNLGINK